MLPVRLLVAALSVSVLGFSTTPSLACDTAAPAPTAEAGRAACAAITAAEQAPAQVAPCAAKSAAAASAEASGCTAGKAAAAPTTGSCAGHGAKSAAAGSARAAAAAAAPGCASHGTASVVSRSAGDGCEACADMAAFDEELRAAAARVQVVRLKNGVIFVYTAEGPTQVRAIQAAMSRRSQRWHALLAAGDKARLCSECKAMRGAMASGKLDREVVNIEGGVLTVMTTRDPALVTKLHAMVEGPLSERTRN